MLPAEYLCELLQLPAGSVGNVNIRYYQPSLLLKGSAFPGYSTIAACVLELQADVLHDPSISKNDLAMRLPGCMYALGADSVTSLNTANPSHRFTVLNIRLKPGKETGKLIRCIID